MKFPTKWILVTLFFTLCFFSSGFAKPKVELGIDVLAANNFHSLEGKRIGLITNPTGVSSSGRSTIDILRSAPNLHLVALYAPEHGVYGSELAGAYVAETTDPRTGLPVHSLYGPTRKPTPQMLQGIDVLIYDIQDIGCRSYTYISTMGLAMEAAGELGIEFYVLDRPDPEGGNRVEGPPVDPRFRSFVGQWPIPYVYGMTPGELARMINAEKWITSRPRLTIVPMRGYHRSMYWQDTGLMWVPTSPHIPTPESAVDYAVTGLIGDAGPISHGVGYTLPFSLFAAPNFNAFKVADDLNGANIAGIFFRPTFFKPFYGGMKDEVCQGVQLYYTDLDKVNLVNLSMYLLDKAEEYTHGALFKHTTEENIGLFDKLYGSDQLRLQLLEGRKAVDLIPGWSDSLSAFKALRKKYLIYDVPPKKAPVPVAPTVALPATPARLAVPAPTQGNGSIENSERSN